ncbi:DUF1700 domain-containing protein [Bacillus sp. C28GYM-DRY-1]|uniref:DUF1700 domain-containing protein n=1 Tax=Bacillus sp. C28GYM-DRY-1 TaxID=3062686 RepID=UPI002676F64D|nr:DUF1700 domain-containing protein [Bacillus sp. C28GYM-DRY-1]MDO3662397.1 DUF1700 domain-containing protein [Bacillus sp. C28GYM-DRY-1]
MTMDDYVKQLKEEIKHMPKHDQKEIIEDILELFHSGKSEGKHEEQIIQSLGTPKALARTLEADLFINKASEKKTWYSIFKVFTLLLGMSLLNFLLLFAPFLLIVSVILSVVVIGILLIASSFFVYTIAPLMSAIFNSMILLGTGLLLFRLGIDLSKLLLPLCLRYLKWNINIVKREGSY